MVACKIAAWDWGLRRRPGDEAPVGLAAVKVRPSEAGVDNAELGFEIGTTATRPLPKSHPNYKRSAKEKRSARLDWDLNPQHKQSHTAEMVSLTS
jgi:hypothetical protein